MDRDRGGRRFDDGEVVRYGAGESWRPTPRGGNDNRDRDRDRSPPPPRRPRSPPPRDHDRDRSRPRSPRPRSPPMASDSYVPGGRYVPPRRRSNSRGGPPGALGGDRYRRDRSRGDSPGPRRRERTRSPPPAMSARRSPMRRSPSRRGTPRRFSPGRGDRFERPRSPPPRRDWGDRDREVDRRDKDDAIRNRDWRGRDRSRDRDFDRRDDRRDDRRRSRSPVNRLRSRSPAGRGTPPTRGGSWRPSRSPSRRGGDRFQTLRRSPQRDSNISSAMNSQPASNRASPRPGSLRARSPLPSRDQSPAGISRPGVSREPSARSNLGDQPRSPPRGPAALRAPPTGPAASRSFSSPSQPHASGGNRDTTSPTLPPSGPRGYVPPARGGYSSRGGRGGWNGPPPRHAGPSPGPSGPTGPSSIPTGPRASSNTPGSSTSTQSRPFNPPTGPSAGNSSIPRQSLAQSLLATMPPIIPGGRLSPSWTPMVLGVTKELEPHYLKLREEEEKIREQLSQKQERLRKDMYIWNRLDRESKACRIRSELSEQSLNNLAGEGTGGAAF